MIYQLIQAFFALNSEGLDPNPIAKIFSTFISQLLNFGLFCLKQNLFDNTSNNK